MPTPIEELDFSDLGESFKIGLEQVPEALAAIPKGLLTRHDAFWRECLNGSDALHVTPDEIRILLTKNIRGFKKLVAWFVAGSMALQQDVDTNDAAACDQYQCDLAWLYIYSVHLCLHELTAQSFELFYTALQGRISINVITHLLEDANLTKPEDPKGHIMDSILTELVMDHIGNLLYREPTLLSPENLSKDDWATALHQLTLREPQLNRLILDGTCRAMRRKGEKLRVKHYSSLAEQRRAAREGKLLPTPDPMMIEEPESPKRVTANAHISGPKVTSDGDTRKSHAGTRPS